VQSAMKNWLVQFAMLAAVLVGLGATIAVVSNNANAATTKAYQTATEYKLPQQMCAETATAAAKKADATKDADAAKEIDAAKDVCKTNTQLEVSAETEATAEDRKAVGLAATTTASAAALKSKTVVANMCHGITKPKLEEPTGPACSAGRLVVRVKFVYDKSKKKVWANWVSCSEGGRLWDIDRKWCGHHSNGTKKMNAGADWKIQFIEVGTTYTSWIQIDCTYTGKVTTRGGAT
jgi:hypothetical protein